MPRPRERVCLQDGLRLDLNRLNRKGFIKFGSYIVGTLLRQSQCGACSLMSENESLLSNMPSAPITLDSSNGPGRTPRPKPPNTHWRALKKFQFEVTA